MKRLQRLVSGVFTHPYYTWAQKTSDLRKGKSWLSCKRLIVPNTKNFWNLDLAGERINPVWTALVLINPKASKDQTLFSLSVYSALPKGRRQISRPKSSSCGPVSTMCRSSPQSPPGHSSIRTMCVSVCVSQTFCHLQIVSSWMRTIWIGSPEGPRRLWESASH